MTMTLWQEVITRLRGMKEELATRYDLRETGISGSVAVSGNDREHTLVLVAEFGPDADPVTSIGLWHYPEDIFGPGDLVSKKALHHGWMDGWMDGWTRSCRISCMYE